MSDARPASGPVAVLDTTVLVATWSRLVLQNLAASPSPAYRPVWSEWIVAETWRVLTWRWAQRGLGWEALSASANAMLRHLIEVMTLVSLHGQATPASAPPLTDPDDMPIWATAVLANAQYVVSDNTRDFPPLIEERAIVAGRACLLARHRYRDIEYLTAIEFIEDVLVEQPEEILGRPLPAAGVVRSRRATRFL